MMKSHKLRAMLAIACFSIAVLPACDVFGVSSGEVVVGIIEIVDPNSDTLGALASPDDDWATRLTLPALETPDTVAAGEPFDVIVRTFVPDGCWREAGADLEVEARHAEITAFDRKLRDPEIVCHRGIDRMVRSVQVTFAESGPATILLVGRRMIVGEEERPLDHVGIEHAVLVQ